MLLKFPIFITMMNVWLPVALCHGRRTRTSPPAGAIIVRSASPRSGEFATISKAVDALPNDSSSQIIFIYPGTYTEQVNIERPGPLTIFGYTPDTMSYVLNTVTIEFGLSSVKAGGDEPSGTLRIHKDDFKMYNVNVKNTFGVGSPAIAISQYGNRVGLYGCAFVGFQDTVLAESGSQVYLRGYIEGAVDFVFGQAGLAYFGGNTIAVKGPGYVTASGRASNDNTSYVFNNNKIVLATNATSNTAYNVFLGRPWRDYAKVIFKNTIIHVPLNKAVWSPWGPLTGNVYFAAFNSTGAGINGTSYMGFPAELTSDDNQAEAFTISSTVGYDYKNWVDPSYVV